MARGRGAAGAWPQVFHDSRRWCFLTLKPGTEPLKALVEPFLDTWQLGATDPERVKQQNGWIELLRDGKATLRDLLDATERRYKELDQPKPPAFFLYVDQGEELVRARRGAPARPLFGSDCAGCRRSASVRADEHACRFPRRAAERRSALYKVHRKIDVPPLREVELREVVSRPAELLSARFETDGLADTITRGTAEDSVKDVGALPLLSYRSTTCGRRWSQRADGVLRLPAQAFELGGVLVDRADAFLAAHPKSEDELRRIFTLKLATVREDEEPTRRRAPRSEFSDEEWRLISELADHPNRLLVTATPEGGETYAEVAHEAIFRRWGKLREWIAAEREFLAWRTGLEAARRGWEAAPQEAKDDALLMGFPLAQASRWLAQRKDDLPRSDREFVERSIARDAAERKRRERLRRRSRQLAAVAAVLMVAIIAGPALWWKRAWLNEQAYWLVQVHPLSSDKEHAVAPGGDFVECTDCPRMVVVPPGNFTMGSLEASPFFKMELPPTPSRSKSLLPFPSSS